MSKPDRKVKVAIIGAGSAGLSAYGEVKKKTDDFVVINYGPYGTTCARVGCMPSKVLIQAANDFHRRKKLEAEGIHGGNDLRVDTAETMQFVRSLRDRFVRGVMGTVDAIGDKNIQGFATFVDQNTLEVDGQKIIAEKIIIGVGTRPYHLDSWASVSDDILTSDSIFEVADLPKSAAVAGAGVIGLELGQAMHRLGVDVDIFGRSKTVAGLTDPAIKEYAISAINKELPLHFESSLEARRAENGLIDLEYAEKKFQKEKLVSAMGRRLNTDRLGLENIGVQLNEKGLPNFNRHTMQIGDLPIYIAGDITDERPILHEASDEGKIAGFNAVRDEQASFQRKTPIYVTFCDPEIAMVGKSHKQLVAEGIDFQTGEVTFEGQGRSIVMQKECGLLHVYGDSKTGELLGAEMIAPKAEHLAHLLAWSMQQRLSVFDVLKFPFYHPVVEEGLRTSLRDLSSKIDTSKYFEMRPVP